MARTSAGKPLAGGIAAVAAIALIAALLAPPVAAADEPPVRVRFGTGEERFDIPDDGGVVETTTPTLEYRGGYHGAEIVVDAGDGVTAASGRVTGGDWVVTEGTLSPGGSYEWHVVAPLSSPSVGVGAPTIDRHGNVSGDMPFGMRAIRHTQAQAPQTFDVATGVGAPTAATGLTTDFFPHYDLEAQVELDDDGNPVDDLPPTVLPGPGSETVSETAIWDVTLDNDNIDTCRYERRLTGEELSRILCEFGYHIDASATVTEDAGHAAAHNVAGDNVTPSLSMVITEDQTVGDGYVISTGGSNRISPAFPLQTEFGFRSLGYLQVPETGTYRFGTQSPGGAELVVYDTTDTDLGRTEVSDPDAWWPVTLGESYEASTDEFHFRNRATGGSDIISHPWNGTIVRYRFEYGPNDASWFQAPDDAVRDLTEDLRSSGPEADVVRWGTEMHLEADRVYPIVFNGWVGPINGNIGIHIDSESTGQIPLPLEWLTAAPLGTIDFDRDLGEPAVAHIDGVAFAMSGHGDTLASLDAMGDLHFYETDGAVGWRHVDRVPHVGFAMPPYAEWAADGTAMAFDDEGHTLAVALDRWPVSGEGRGDTTKTTTGIVRTNKDLEGEIRTWSAPPAFIQDDGRYTMEIPDRLWIHVLTPDGEQPMLWVSDLAFRLDAHGRVLDSVVDGEIQLGQVLHPIVDVGGHWDAATGDLQLDFITETNTYGVLFEQRDVVPGPPSELPGPFDVAIVGKIDPDGPWTSENTTVDYVNDLLDGAGLELPWVDAEPRATPITYEVQETRADLSGNLWRWTGAPEFGRDRDTGSFTLLDRFGINVDVTATGTLFPADVTITDLSFRLDADGNVIDSVAAGIVAQPGKTWTIGEVGGRVSSDNDRLFLDFMSSDEDGIRTWGMSLDLISAGDATTAVPHDVQISTDGHTVAVRQPVGDAHRIVVVDRDGYEGAWQVVGTFPVGGDAQMAVGRDGDVRFLALADGSAVTVHEWTPTSGDWQQVASLAVDGTVGSLSLDYWAEHLAIGQPDIGRVTVYQRPWWSSDWTHQADLDGDAGFGSDLDYDWQMLTVGNSSASHIRIYRDNGHQPWSTYGDWVQANISGPGSELLQSTGGSPHFHRSVSTIVDLGGAYSQVSTHLG